MDLVADARLTAAVSAAGGLGLLGGGYGDEAWLARELDALAAVGARFGVGFITWSLAKQARCSTSCSNAAGGGDAVLRRPRLRRRIQRAGRS